MPPAGFEPTIERPQSHALDLTHCLCVLNYVEVVTGLRARRPRNRDLILGRRNKFFLLQFVQTGPGAHAAFYSVGTGGGLFFPGVKRQGCEAYRSFQCAKFKNEWRYYLHSPTRFHRSTGTMYDSLCNCIFFFFANVGTKVSPFVLI